MNLDDLLEDHGYSHQNKGNDEWADFNELPPKTSELNKANQLPSASTGNQAQVDDDEWGDTTISEPKREEKVEKKEEKEIPKPKAPVDEAKDGKESDDDWNVGTFVTPALKMNSKKIAEV